MNKWFKVGLPVVIAVLVAFSAVAITLAVTSDTNSGGIAKATYMTQASPAVQPSGTANYCYCDGNGNCAGNGNCYCDGTDCAYNGNCYCDGTGCVAKDGCCYGNRTGLGAQNSYGSSCCRGR